MIAKALKIAKVFPGVRVVSTKILNILRKLHYRVCFRFQVIDENLHIMFLIYMFTPVFLFNIGQGNM